MTGNRATDGRLTGFSHATKGPLDSSVTFELRMFAAAMQKGSTQGTATEGTTLQTLGIAYLLADTLDAAIEMLRHAAEKEPANPAILNDLAVAYLERAARRHSGKDIVEAFESLDRALRLDPSTNDAWFNRALAIERLGLRADAITAWREFVRREGVSPWSSEAAGHIRRLSQPTQADRWHDLAKRVDHAAAAGDREAAISMIGQYPQQARASFEDDLTGAWAKAETAGDHRESERILRMLGIYAEALRRTTKNLIPERAVQSITEAATERERLSRLVRGHLAYHEGRSLYIRARAAEAEPFFTEARALLAESKSPFATLASFYGASSRSYANDIASTHVLLDDVERELKSAGLADSPAYGHVQWVRGRSLLKEGFPHASLRCFQTARTVFEQNREIESIAAIDDLLAYNYDFLGDQDQAWNYYIAAVTSTEQTGAARRERVTLHDVSSHAVGHGYPRTAFLYADTLVRLATAHGDPGDHARALLDRSRSLHAIGDQRAASEDIKHARVRAANVADPGLRDELSTDLAAAEADVAVPDSPAEVLESFDRAIRIVLRVGKETLLPRLWTGRARAARRAHQPDQAERSLREGIAVIERHRWSVADRDLRIAFGEQWYRAFDEMVDLLVEENRGGEALTYAERSRARVLFDDMITSAGSRTRDFSPREYVPPASLPPGIVALVYASLDDSTVLWLVRGNSVVCKRLPLPRRELERLVAALAAERSDGPPEDNVRQALGDLHDAIFRPIRNQLLPAERLLIIPDKALQSVPFNALYDRERARWLIQDRLVGVAPSLDLFAFALARDAKLAHFGRNRILTVGDPAFDQSRFPDLPRLGAAEREARAIGRMYDSATTITGSEATPARFKQSAQGFPVVHIAAHTLPNPRLPSWSALLFAPEPHSPDTGVLYAFEIDSNTFASARLVVLAGCRTASGKETRYEGFLGLARSFMAAGVPSVVATLWDVEDDASEQLLLTFHRRLRAGDDTWTALRNAQLTLIRSPDPALRRVAAWAGFQTIGGYLQACPSNTKGGAPC